MWELIRYSFLTKVRDLSLIFWPFLFPLALATAMYFSIGQMEEADFETIPAAVVSRADRADDPFLTYMEAAEESTGMTDLQVMSEEEAETALHNGEIGGIFYSGEVPSLTVSGSGFPESILQMLLESYTESRQTLKDVEELHPEGLEAAAAELPETSAIPLYEKEEQLADDMGETYNGIDQQNFAPIDMCALHRKKILLDHRIYEFYRPIFDWTTVKENQNEIIIFEKYKNS